MPEHEGHTVNIVCGEAVCATCYGQALTTERFRTRRPAAPLPAYECCGVVYMLHKSDHHVCEEVPDGTR